jgi:NAD(P)-dependent dehydrogenase (short-subunit alcohol dehydrogenase family)
VEALDGFHPPGLAAGALSLGPQARPLQICAYATSKHALVGLMRTPRSAQLVAFLASGESAFMTGATIPLDGGMSV